MGEKGGGEDREIGDGGEGGAYADGGGAEFDGFEGVFDLEEAAFGGEGAGVGWGALVEGGGWLGGWVGGWSLT